jgi:RHS repeat-associated protein
LSIGQHDIACLAGDANYNSARIDVTPTVVATVDMGTITLTVNGIAAATASYGASSTATSVAAGLVAGVTANSPVTLTDVDGTVYMVSKTTGATTDYAYALQDSSYDSADFPQASFVSSPVTGTMAGGANASAAVGTLYKYTILSYVSGSNPVGYDAAGNVVGFTDTAMGNWGFSYDSLNRLAGGATSQAGNTKPNYCWSYDPFGNRAQQEASSLTFVAGSGGLNTCTPQSSASVSTDIASFNGYNQITSTNARGATVTPQYDGRGNVTTDGLDTYLYDAEGRICASKSQPVPGVTAMTGYAYDADGQRVGKGPITVWSCDLSTNGYQTGSDFVLGASGEQLTELSSAGGSGLVVQHTNIFAAGALIGTYDPDGLHFYITDWLGSRRAQTDYEGVLEATCTNLPYGDALQCSNSLEAPTERHFTGKERDSESGNDYFTARYYGSSMGRFLSPDDVIITPERLTNPQQLNLYAYVANNPLRYIDPTGEILQCVGNADSQKQCFSDLQQIAGDAANRLSMDAKTGFVSFDTKDLDMSKNEGAGLVNDLVGSKNTYDFSVGPTIMTDKGPVRVDHIGLDMANLPAFGNQRRSEILRLASTISSTSTSTIRISSEDQIPISR